MKRVQIEERSEWENKIAKYSKNFGVLKNGKRYWNEGVFYKFSRQEIEKLKNEAQKAYDCFLTLIPKLLEDRLYMDSLGISLDFQEYMRKTFQRGDKHYSARFDIGLDKNGNFRVLEMNPDTHGSLAEAMFMQDEWREDVFPDKSQFNDLQGEIENFWKQYKNRKVFFTCVQSEDDFLQTYLQNKLAEGCGVNSTFSFLNSIKFNETTLRFEDNLGNIVENIFKFYPWDWLMNEDQIDKIIKSDINWLNPAWTMLMSKCILPRLYDEYPENVNFIKASFDKESFTQYVEKPSFSRQGSGVRIVKNEQILEENANFEGSLAVKIYQEFVEFQTFDEKIPILGVWVVDGKVCGMGIRETEGLITKDDSSFTPHIIS